MSLTDPSILIRSPSYEASGLRLGAVSVTRLLRSVAVFFGFRRPAEARCSAPLSRSEKISLDAWFADLAFRYTRAVVQACRPVSATFHSDGALMVEIPRVVTTICAASTSVDAQGPCLLFEMHSNTDRMPWASTNTRHFIHGERA